MLELAGSLAQLDPQERQAVARLNGVAVHSVPVSTARRDMTPAPSRPCARNTTAWAGNTSSPKKASPAKAREKVALGTRTHRRMAGYARAPAPAGAAILLAGPQ